MARPKDPDKLTFASVGLRPAEWEWLRKWRTSDDSPTRCLSEFVQRGMLFWPNGPEAGLGRAVKRPRHRAPSAVKRYAELHGLTRTEAFAVIAKLWFDEHPEDGK